MYKDKDKQKEAQRDWVRQKRAKAKGSTDQSEQTVVEPEQPDISNFGGPDCECMHCQSQKVNNSKFIINHGPHKTAAELGPNEVNRVSLPGDVDYAPLGPTQICWCCDADIREGTVCCGPCAWSGRAKAKRAGSAPPRLVAQGTN